MARSDMATIASLDQHAAGFSVAVVDDDPKVRTRLALQLGAETRAAAFASLELLEPQLHGAAVVVLGPSFASPAGLQQAGRFIRARSEVSAVLAMETLSAEVLQQAIRAGLSDAVALDGDPLQLAEAVGRAAGSLNMALPRSPAAPTPEEPDAGARVTTMFSTKGGAGKSMMATNLAVVLAGRSERPVVLVDADLQFGDVGVMLKLSPQRTIIDAVQLGDQLDEEALRNILIPHEPSGLLVLPAPVEPAFADSVGPADMVRILAVLREFCDHVVVDTPAYLNDVVLALLEESDDIVVMAGMDVPLIKNVKIGLQTLRLLNIPAAKVKLVINRANSKVKLDISDVERILQLKADCLLPSDIAVPQSVNKGAPIVLESPRSGVARSLERLAASFPAHRRQQTGGR